MRDLFHSRLLQKMKEMGWMEMDQKYQKLEEELDECKCQPVLGNHGMGRLNFGRQNSEDLLMTTIEDLTRTPKRAGS